MQKATQRKRTSTGLPMLLIAVVVAFLCCLFTSIISPVSGTATYNLLNLRNHKYCYLTKKTIPVLQFKSETFKDFLTVTLTPSEFLGRIELSCAYNRQHRQHTGVRLGWLTLYYCIFILSQTKISF